MSQINPYRKIVNKFSSKRILVIGDILVDKYIVGKAERISPEAPVVVVNVKNEKYLPGGASNVANNIASLGAKTYLAGAIGDDIVGRRFLRDLNGLSINTDLVTIDNQRSTIVKTRLIANNQQLVRFDYEEKLSISNCIENSVFISLKNQINQFDAIIISDYDKGFLTPSLITKIICLARKSRKPVFAGPKPNNIRYYKHCTSLSLNRSEALRCNEILRLPKTQSIEEIGRRLLKKLHLISILITLSEKGMLLTQEKGQTLIPACAKEVYDVTGAGDTALAVFSLAAVAGADKVTAAKLANKAAGIVVGKVGTATLTLQELKQTESNF